MKDENDLITETEEKKEEVEEIVEEAPTEESTSEETTPPIDETELKKKKKKKIIIIVCIIVALLLIAGITIFFLIRNKKDNKQENNGNANQITITFDSNGGNKIDPLKVEKNSRINYPIPERENHLFIGWFNVEEKVSRTTTFDSDVTLTAHWEELKDTTKTMVITFNTDDIVELENKTIICDTPIDLPIYLEKEVDNYRYSLEKWTDENGKDVNNNDILPCKDITLTAVWYKRSTSEETKCPSGFSPRDNRCVKFESPVINCQNGTIKTDFTCLDFNDKNEGEKVCNDSPYIHNEDGSFFSAGLGEYFDGKCGYYELKGYTEDMCVKKYEEGPVWANGKCYATVHDHYAHQIKCPEGYSYFYKDNICYKEHLEYVNCPEGFELDPNGYKTCYQYTDMIE